MEKNKKDKVVKAVNNALLIGAVYWGLTAAYPIGAAFNEPARTVAVSEMSYKIAEISGNIEVPSWYGIEKIVNDAYNAASKISLNNLDSEQEMPFVVYNIIMSLFEKTGRLTQNSVNTVKIVKGFISDSSGLRSRVWLEYLVGDKWRRCDTFDDSGCANSENPENADYYPIIESRVHYDALNIGNSEIEFVSSSDALLKAPYQTPKILFGLLRELFMGQ